MFPLLDRKPSVRIDEAGRAGGSEPVRYVFDGRTISLVELDFTGFPIGPQVISNERVHRGS